VRYAARYSPPIEHAVMSRTDDDYNVARIEVDRITIAIEGELRELTERRIVEDARRKLAAIGHAPYSARRAR
jgi:hypothetical protein